MENKILFNNICSIENAAEDGGVLRIEGYCAHYGKPNLNMEIVDAASFETFFGMYGRGELKPDLNYQHTDTVIGDIDTIESRESGLWISAHLNYGVKIVDEMIAPNVLKGSLCKFSTEGYIQNGIDGIEERGENYYVRDFLLTGVAVVRTPADPKAVFCVKNYMDAWKSEHAPKRKWYVMF